MKTLFSSILLKIIPLIAIAFFCLGHEQAISEESVARISLKLGEISAAMPGIVLLDAFEAAYYLSGTSHLGFGTRFIGDWLPLKDLESQFSMYPTISYFPIFIDFNLRDAIEGSRYIPIKNTKGAMVLNHTIFLRLESSIIQNITKTRYLQPIF
jgi:hypothetical protein